MEAFLETQTDDLRPLEVWMDGDCGLCQRSMAWCQLRDPNGRVRFVDFRVQGKDQLPLTLEAHQQSMWVRDRDGTLYEGFAAWRRILAQIPGWKWLARLTSLPPFTLIGPSLYRLLATHRHRFRRP
jgi:predicted DCC family thiol-disulfide oxidoreductase YuxK